jgi:hypothetical protein
MRAASEALDFWRAVGEQNVSDFGWAFLEAYNSSASKAPNTVHMPSGQLPDTLMRTWANSEIFVARPDTVDLVTAAAQSLPYHPVLAWDEMPCDFGFLRLLKPLQIWDRQGRTLCAHAIQWWRAEMDMEIKGEKGKAQVIHYAIYSDASDPNDDYNQDPAAKKAADRGLKWPLAFLGFVPASQKMFKFDVTEIVKESDWETAFLQKWLTSWWLMLRQQMVDAPIVSADRPTRRRAQQALNTKELPEIKVVDLRRREKTARDDAFASDGNTNWTHRWGVRPHWRRQWYPSTQEHKLILIDFQIRGPEDKPLKLRPTVFDVRPPG